ncbi:MAG: MFS transporter [Bdellovibrionales bacterium]|nr:MFS transporter [Bdellovibrionales bacterium]
MLLWKALKHRGTRLLWIGQLTSAVGDEIHRVAFVWLSVQLIGSDTGYLASLSLTASILMSFFGTRIVDHLPSERAMVKLDFIRAIIVVIPVIFYLLGLPTFVILVVCAVAISAFSALFEPVVMETVPKVANEPNLLKAANGLMSTTFRLGRVVGPAIVGLLGAFIPMIHFFTIDMMTFFISAYSIHAIRLPKSDPIALPPFSTKEFLRNYKSSMMLLKSKPAVYRALMAKCLTGGCWYVAYGLGLALLANEITPNNVKTFGVMVSFYGIGNVASALWFGNIQRKNSELLIYSGLIYLGITFLMISAAKTLPLLFLFAALSAVGGPWNDLPFVDLVQAHFKRSEIAKIFRLRNMTETFFMLVMTTTSPILFKICTVRGTIAICAGIMLIAGIYSELGRRRDITKLAHSQAGSS